jgi:hypothetical protein
MGKASRAKRDRREELPEKFDFGPEFLEQSSAEWVDLVVQAGVATASGKGGNL